MASPGVGVVRLTTPPRPPHPALHVCDDGQRPSYRGGMAQACRDDLPDGVREIFLPQGLDSASEADGAMARTRSPGRTTVNVARGSQADFTSRNGFSVEPICSPGGIIESQVTASVRRDDVYPTSSPV
jgi:hypothetical protein